MSKAEENYDNEFMAQREYEIKQAYAAGAADNSAAYSPAMFGSQNKQNLVEWQLDFSHELEDIERLLRCDVLINDKNGKERWVRNPNSDSVVFNEQGVNDILREIILLVNKNKVLSNYKLDEIKPRVRMMGHELRVFIFNNYEKYGMDNEYKMNCYSMMVLSILDVIESAYRRALNGEERRDLNQARTVMQQEPMMPQNINVYPGSMMQKQKKWYNPFTWGR
jgi:hypothetical protein